MRSIPKTKLALAIAPILFSTSAYTAAQSVTLEEVVVTARKKEESLQTIPLSVSAVTGKAMRETMVSNMEDAQQGMANVNFAVRLGSAVPTIRGVGFSILNNGTTANVAMHVNGVYIGRPMAVASSFFDVDRLEVVRGPQGTLYGRNATGGAVNIVTNRPTEELSGYIDTSFGNYNSATVEAAISGPLFSDKVLGRIAIRTDRHDGWAKNIFSGNDTDAQDLQAIRATMRFLPSDNLTLDWVVENYHQDDSMYGMKFGGKTNPEAELGGVLLGGDAFPIGSRDINTERDILNKRDIFGTDLTAVWEMDDYTFKSITAFRDTEVNVESDIDATNVVVFSGPNREEEAEQWSQEFQLTYDGDKLSWLAGAFYFNEENDIATVSKEGFLLPSAPAPFYPPDDGVGTVLLFVNGANVETTSYAVFGEATYQFSDAWSATAGLRYTYEDVEINGEYSPLVTVMRDCDALECDLDFSNVSPRGIIQYQPSDEWMFFASVSDGFKSGGFSVGALAPSFDEEEIRSYEIGAKATLMDERVQLSLTAFSYDYEDLQVTKVLDASALTENAANAGIEGLEFEAKMLLTDNFQIDASLGILNAEFEDFESENPTFPGTPPQDLSGNQLPQAPDVTANIAAEYTWTVKGGDLTLRGEAVYSDEYYLTSFNERPDYQDSYTMYNAFVNYNHPSGVRVGAYIRNADDELVKSSGYTTIFALGTPSFTAYLPPRTYGVSFGYSF
ncbi:TonB-dependent receptor, plug [Luminiphilus syltensis NOR5-1B]|uniref:TonB-dependent receptor, plug n=1 Tax=Luminiphilus syltensis NOR5-1B TaxID=565045 RepID=B8KS28_9GAMM|nr:TonB-dependent receptor [Luminiphilus syltensis]EED35487.1 TonB-dependent receptor, plug [Luminiphilus syltensis NOR5-1B]